MSSLLRSKIKVSFLSICYVLIILATVSTTSSTFAYARINTNTHVISHLLNKIPGSLKSHTIAFSNTLGLSTTSGPAGTHVLLNGSGFIPGESYVSYWNYTAANGRPSVREESFFLFNPN